MSRVISRSEFLSASDLKFEDVPVPEMGEDLSVRIAILTGHAREEYSKLCREREASQDTSEIQAILVSITAIDVEGKLLFSPEDVKKINDKSSAVLDRLCTTAMKLNGLTEEAMEDLAKNLGSGPSSEAGSA